MLTLAIGLLSQCVKSYWLINNYSGLYLILNTLSLNLYMKKIYTYFCHAVHSYQLYINMKNTVELIFPKTNQVKARCVFHSRNLFYSAQLILNHCNLQEGRCHWEIKNTFISRMLMDLNIVLIDLKLKDWTVNSATFLPEWVCLSLPLTWFIFNPSMDK